MIKRLHLLNFRRHADTEITFGDDQKLVVIEGLNGAGKSSIVEGIVYGLYGEPRQGRAGRRRSHVENLVRRGAEFEGMQVELDFTIADTEYSVVRRRDNKLSTAVLYGNGNQLVEGADQVTAEITRILGMNAVGFRLAVVAEQRELDGLASLQPAKRSQMLAKLLRLDALTAAHDKARVLFNQEREVVRSLGSGDDLATLKAQKAEAEEALAKSQSVLAASTVALASLEAELLASESVDAQYQAAHEAHVRAEAALAAAVEEVGRIEFELSSLVVPDALEMETVDLSVLVDAASALERKIAQAETAKELAGQRAMMASELELVQSRMRVVSAEYELASQAGSQLGQLSSQLAEAEKQVESIQARVDELGQTESFIRAGLVAAKDRVVVAAGLGAVCDSCHQPIGEEHRRNQLAEAERAVVTQEAALSSCSVELAAGRDELELSKAEVSRLTAMRAELTAQASGIDRLSKELADLTRRADTYSGQLLRITVDDVDLEELYAERSELGVTIAVANQANEAARVRSEALELQAQKRITLAEATARCSQAEVRLVESIPAEELVAAHTKRQQTLEAKADEEAMAAFLTTEVAVATERVVSANSLLARAESMAAKRRQHEAAAVAASNAATLLEAASVTLSTRIRPALEGEVSRILSALSSGRYDAVKIDADYNVTIRDDDRYLPLSEFSGGEVDLVALAMRLALAEVVGERQGVDALGLLVLDECFGSQDRFRRESIRSTLRNLRETRGQIILISHVEGLEDIADLVIDVNSSEDEEGVRSAEVVLT